MNWLAWLLSNVNNCKLDKCKLFDRNSMHLFRSGSASKNATENSVLVQKYKTFSTWFCLIGHIPYTFSITLTQNYVLANSLLSSSLSPPSLSRLLSYLPILRSLLARLGRGYSYHKNQRKRMIFEQIFTQITRCKTFWVYKGKMNANQIRENVDLISYWIGK